jgi:iron complex transport system substrate-binding protein
MRARRALPLLLSLAVAATACGGDAAPSTAPDAPTDGAQDTEVEEPADGDDAAAFPVTIEHTHGSTTIEERPERVVVVGLRDTDAVLALGVTPVATREWFGEQPDAVWPWAQDELGDADPVVLDPIELDLEVVAGLDPDVIIGVDSGLTPDEYALLSEIAPTVAQPATFPDFAVPWRDRTRLVARALGEVDRAEELIADVEARFAEARESHPSFEGATALVGLAGVDGQAFVYAEGDARSEVLTELGFEVPDVIESQVPEGQFFLTLSQERFDELDADVLVWIGGDADAFETVTDAPLYPTRVEVEGRDLFLPYDPLGGAMSFASVLSLPFLLDELVPELELALDGDPATTSTFGG